jgi:hypothetical protein
MTISERKKTMKPAYQFLTLAVIAALTSTSSAQNTLSLKLTSEQTVVVNLTSGQEIAAIQFSLTSSENIVLEGIEKTGLSAGGNWTVASYLKDEHTLNVVIISMSGEKFVNGKGSLAKIAFRMDRTIRPDSSRLTLENVLAADRNADSVTLASESLAWRTGMGTIPSILIAAEESSIRIGQNYPNPFNPSTHIPYVLEKPTHVRLIIYDVTGREISKIVDQYQFPGTYSAQWSSADASGYQLPSGIYFARLEAGEEIAITKMILTK